MFNLMPIVLIVLAILGAAIVLGILWWLVNWLAEEWGLNSIVVKLARTVIVVGACLLCIFFIIYLFNGFGPQPLFRWG